MDPGWVLTLISIVGGDHRRVFVRADCNVTSHPIIIIIDELCQPVTSCR